MCSIHTSGQSTTALIPNGLVQASPVPTVTLLHLRSTNSVRTLNSKIMKAQKYISAFLIILSFGSCSDFLEEDNKSSATAENFYVTTPGYEALINSTYSTLRDVYEPLP